MSEAFISAAPLGVCVLSRPALNRAQPVNYPEYMFEILAHAGLCFARVEPANLREELPKLKMLLTVGEQEFDDVLKQALGDWVRAGGAWLSIGGVCGMSELLGVQTAIANYPNWGGGAVVLGEGYMLGRDQHHPAIAHLQRGLHFFGGIALQSCGAKVIAGSVDSHCREIYRDVLFEHRPGSGRTMTLAIDVTGTVVRIQQGIAVTRDGVSSPDGTAPIADAVLKSSDGAVLDWIFDRQPLPGIFGLNCFLEPVADLWREVVLRSVFHLATVQQIPLPLLWLYPRQLTAIAHLSHDTDNNEPEKARTLLDILQTEQIHSTWCVILPGYDAQLMSDIKSAGHELATHYDAMTGTEGLTWGEAQFDEQHRKLVELFGRVPVTNKNHYLRWEGDAEFFDWCAKRRIELDQSKGPSKTGEAGFNFGSCHPYLPVTFEGRVIDVLELPTLTQDLCVFAPPQLLDALLAGVKRVHGVLHLLFHPAHFHREDVRNAAATAIRRAKEQGMEWWTATQINAWERARRGVRWSNYSVDGSIGSVSIQSVSDLIDATILWLVPGEQVKDRSGTMQAWGFNFAVSTHALVAGVQKKLSTKDTKEHG